MITNIKRSIMGTAQFDGLFAPQRKAQNFICYPLKEDADPSRVLVQSDKRIGHIYFDSGRVVLSPSRTGGSYSQHLGLCAEVGVLTAEELLLLKAQVFATAHGDAGREINHIIGADNSGAAHIFGATA